MSAFTLAHLVKYGPIFYQKHPPNKKKFKGPSIKDVRNQERERGQNSTQKCRHIGMNMCRHVGGVSNDKKSLQTSILHTTKLVIFFIKSKEVLKIAYFYAKDNFIAVLCHISFWSLDSFPIFQQSLF